MNYWGSGGMFEERVGLRNRRLALQNQQLEQELSGGGPSSIIGGQLVEGGDTAGYNAANGFRNAVAADVRARQASNLGSRQVTSMAGTADSALGMDQLQEIQPNGSQVQPQSFAPPAIAPPPQAPQRRDVGSTFESTPRNSILRTASQPFSSTVNELSAGGTRGSDGLPQSSSIGDALNSGRASFNSTDNPTRSGYGFRNGGSVLEKPRMVKQPGYKNGGKVKMPERPRTDVEMKHDRMAAELLMDEGMKRGAAQHANPKYPDDASDIARQKKKKKGMRGYAQGGKVGKKSNDDGLDTVDVRVREGEYMLAPETVGFMGGGSYEEGVRMLDDMGRMATGEEPGPVPVNENGEAQRGFRNGGKMGYAVGGSFAIMPDGTRVAYPPQGGQPITRQFANQPLSAEGAAYEQARTAPRTASAAPQGPPRPSNARMGARKIADRAGRFAASEANKRPLRTIAKGVGAGLKKIPGGRLTSLPVAIAGSVGHEIGSAAYDAGIETGADWVDTVGGTINNIGVRSGLWGDPAYDTQIADGNRLANEITGGATPVAAAAVIDEATGQVVSEPGAAAPAGDPNQFYRPFDGGAVDLRDMPEAAASQEVDPGGMNIVQRTGGPNGEVIVREDIGGVPTFSNLRTAPQAGDAATLQAQADARAAEDMGIRERNNAVVEQMRRSAPVYGQDAVAQRQAEMAARQERALAAAKDSPNMSLTDLQGEFKSLGMFSDPETGDFLPDQFAGFVQQVINPLVEAGQIDPAALTPAQIMELAVSGQDAMGITARVNQGLRNNDRLPTGGIVTPDMVGEREDADFFGDLGWWNDRSDLGFREALMGDKRVIQTPDGPITLPADDIGLRTQRQAQIYGN